MKNIRFKIHKLGAIENSEITLNRFILISGESGLGKSYLAALSNYLFQLLYQPYRLNAIISEYVKVDTNLDSGTIKISKKEFERWLSKDVVNYLIYLFNSNSIEADVEIDLPINNMVFTWQTIQEEIGNKAERFLLVRLNNNLSYKSKDDDGSINPMHPFTVLVSAFLSRLVYEEYTRPTNLILPPSRGCLLTEDVQGISGMYQLFIAQMQALRAATQFSENERNNEIIEVFNKILEGKVGYNSESKKYFYKIAGKGDIPMSAAASSIKELAPLAMFIEQKAVDKSSFLIEEPESHLHPQKQRMMADVLALLLGNGAYLQITTHSDYLLRRLDELIKLGTIKSRKEKLFKKACEEIKADKNLAIDSTAINAYLLRRREDDSVEIVAQNIDEGVNFDSFYSALRDNINNDAYLENILEDL